jgi:uncharacterized membrane protein YgcG
MTSLRAKSVRSLIGVAVVLAASFSVRPQFADLRLDRPQQHISDLAGVLDSSTGIRIENVLANLQERTGINFVVVTVKTAGNQDLYDLSIDLANEWKIGSQASDQKSLLLLIATDKASFYALSSGGAARDLPYGLVGVMGRRMRPKFQEGDYSQGLETGLRLFVDILGERSNFTFAALDRQRPGPSQPASETATPAIANAIFKPTEKGAPRPARAPVATMNGSAAAGSERDLSSLPLTSTDRTELRSTSDSSLRRFAGRSPLVLPPEKALPVRLPRFRTPPVINGHLDDEVWRQAYVLKDFYQVQPGDNTAPSHRTEVLLGYDDKFLYVAFRAHDDAGKVRTTIAARDQIFDDDTVGMYLDTFNDQRKAYQLFFNPLGVQADAVFTEGQGSDASVDIVMESKGAITEDGYVVEIAIPFKSLRYEAGEGKLWGVHFQRHIKHLNDELDSWMPISRDLSGYLNQEGHLTGLEGISTERTLEIIPTLTISERGQRKSAANPTSPDENQFVNQAPKFKPGLTMKYGIRPNVTASLTLNPDFADVEADQTVITANQRFPIFFEEKRPFFLEGIDIFRTPLQAVHTRAIVSPDVAGKLTGKVGRNTFGFLFASDPAPGNFSQEERSDPKKSAKIAKFLDKNATIAVLRLKHDLGRQSSIGMIATSYNFIEKHNQLAGVDGRFRLDQQTTVSFQLLGTTSRRFFYDPNLDNNIYRTGNGFGYAWNFDKSKRHLYLGLSGEGRTRDYIADVGFTKRTDTNSETLYMSYSSEPKPKAQLVSWRVSSSLGANFNWQGHSQNWDDYSDVTFNFQHQTYFNVAFDEGYERLFENEFGASRNTTRAGAFFGTDPGRSTRKRSLFFSGGTTPSKRYSAYAFLGRTWGAFDYDFGAKPRFARVSPAALVDPNAPLDPGPGDSSDVSLFFTYQPTQALRTSFSYTRSKLTRNDTGRVAFSDQIYSLHADYRFTRFLFMRGRLDYDWLSANVLGQLLLGWTPNPGTAVYVGYDDYLNYNGFNAVTGRFEPGLHRNERVFFLKMSYLLRRSFK